MDAAEDKEGAKEPGAVEDDEEPRQAGHRVDEEGGDEMQVEQMRGEDESGEGESQGSGMEVDGEAAHAGQAGEEEKQDV